MEQARLRRQQRSDKLQPGNNATRCNGSCGCQPLPDQLHHNHYGADGLHHLHSQHSSTERCGRFNRQHCNRHYSLRGVVAQPIIPQPITIAITIPVSLTKPHC